MYRIEATDPHKLTVPQERGTEAIARGENALDYIERKMKAGRNNHTELTIKEFTTWLTMLRNSFQIQTKSVTLRELCGAKENPNCWHV